MVNIRNSLCWFSLASLFACSSPSAPSHLTSDDVPKLPTRGMDQPWEEQQAEDAATNAAVIGPSRVKWDSNHIEAEAIGRKAVSLKKTGDYVSFITKSPSNSLVLRYSIPDAPTGGGLSATIGLYVNGKRIKNLELTSKYAWSYQGGRIGDPIVDKPAEQPHTFFDEVHTLLDDLPAGSVVKLQRDAQDTAEFYVIDLVDFEQVAPPLEMPEGFTSITEFGIYPNDGKEHSEDILAALRSGKNLWFPSGVYKTETFNNNDQTSLDNPGVEVRGAGMWYTEFHGRKASFSCLGATSRCVFKDFALYGNSYARAEETQGPQKGIVGPMGKGSLIENIWIEHFVCGIWVGNDPPYQEARTDSLLIRKVRIRNTYADGVNFANGTSNSVLEQSHFRNNGDDSVAIWSVKWTDYVREKSFQVGEGYFKPESLHQPDQGVAHGNIMRKISVQMPWRANCFANYGGNDNHFEDSTCEDVLTYPGLLIDNEFSPYDFGPAVSTFRNITLTRAGGTMFFENSENPWNHGAIKLYLREGSISDILIENIDVIEPLFAGIEFRGFGTNHLPAGEKFHPDIIAGADNAVFQNVKIKNVTITKAGTHGIEILEGGGRGQVNFENVVIRNSKISAVFNPDAPDTFFQKGPGNIGW